tara:strand:- start:219 stop:386 length:168 start_codon:yes stop_codon:yes gene_type:complete
MTNKLAVVSLCSKPFDVFFVSAEEPITFVEIELEIKGEERSDRGESVTSGVLADI